MKYKKNVSKKDFIHKEYLICNRGGKRLLIDIETVRNLYRRGTLVYYDAEDINGETHTGRYLECATEMEAHGYFQKLKRCSKYLS